MRRILSVIFSIFCLLNTVMLLGNEGITGGVSISSFRRISRTDSDDDSHSSICPTALSSAIYKGLSRSFKALENAGGSASVRLFRGLFRRSSSRKTSSNGLQKAQSNLKSRSRAPPKTRGSSPQKRAPLKVFGSITAPPPSPVASPTSTFHYKPPDFPPIDWKSIPKLGLTSENWPENPLLRESPPRSPHNPAPLTRDPRGPVSPSVSSPKRTRLYDEDPRMIAYKQIQEELYALFVQKCPPSKKKFRELMTKADSAWREIRGLEDLADSADFVERYSMKVGPRYVVPLTDNALWWSICIKQCNAIFGYIFVPPPPKTRRIKGEMAKFSAGKLVQVTHGEVDPKVKPRETRPGHIEFGCSCPTNPEFLALAKESKRFDETVFAMFKTGDATLVEGFLRGAFEGTKFEVMSNFEVTVKLEEWFKYHEIQLRKDLTDKEFERVKGEFAGESGVKADDDFWDGVGVVTEVRTRERRSAKKPEKK